ncbi:MAG: ATP-binding protein [Candidatus Omnitrophota bacterium]
MFIEPVFGEKFFGREEVLCILQKRVEALKGGYRQNLALAGPMLAGKSSILKHFLNSITDPDIIPLYIDMSGEDFHMFCRKFIATLLYRYLKSQNVESDGDIEKLKKACGKTIPKTINCVENVYESLRQKKENAAYEKLLTLTSALKTETGKSCIVILDEFHNLSKFRLKKPFQIFGKFIMVQKSTMYIVSSSQKTLLKEILSKKLSLLFGNFELIEIRGFDNQTARSFISERFKKRGSFEDVKDYLIQISQGSPFYLQVLSDYFSELVDKGYAQGAGKECLLEAISHLLYESGGLLNQYFTNNINFFLERSVRKRFIPILVSLAHDNNTIKAIQKDLGRSDKDLGIKLHKLAEMDIVFNSGVFYQISDKLFEYWLKYVYSLKARSVIDDGDMMYLEFKSLIERNYKNHCEFSLKSVPDVVCDLFKTFKNDKIEIGMNFRKMPLFDEVGHTCLSENIHQVMGSTRNKIWLCHIKENDITDEDDIHKLVTDLGNPDASKIARKVFIPLKGMEQNAFLLAKEQNVWVWDIERLNVILRLFGKHELVL